MCFASIKMLLARGLYALMWVTDYFSREISTLRNRHLETKVEVISAISMVLARGSLNDVFSVCGCGAVERRSLSRLFRIILFIAKGDSILEVNQ